MVIYMQDTLVALFNKLGKEKYLAKFKGCKVDNRVTENEVAYTVVFDE